MFQLQPGMLFRYLCQNVYAMDSQQRNQVVVYLEADVDIGPVDGGRPPEGEAPVGDLVETGSLGVGQLLVLHRLLEAGGLLPEETLPSGKVGSLEEGVLEDTLHSPESLDHVRAVVVKVPQLAVVALVSPPERILLQHLENNIVTKLN